jgi:hypothetical protein
VDNILDDSLDVSDRKHPKVNNKNVRLTLVSQRNQVF